jgi:short-subunit dehydrogenase
MATQYPASSSKPLAVVTGASSGIGRHLAVEAARRGFDLVVAADTPLHEVCAELTSLGAQVEAVEDDLATKDGVDRLCDAIGDRPISALLANAGHGLGKAYLAHRVGKQMRARNDGRILFTGSIAGFMPGSFQAVYNGTKAFIDSFALALRNELKETQVTITCLMPGVTDTNFFERADMLDTKVGTQEDKADPAEVARIGFDAMMLGEADVVAGLKNKLQVAMAGITPAEILAEQHRKMAEPGSASKQ